MPPHRGLAPTPRAPLLSRSSLIFALYAGLAAVAVAWGTARGRPDVFRLHVDERPRPVMVSADLGGRRDE